MPIHDLQPSFRGPAALWGGVGVGGAAWKSRHRSHCRIRAGEICRRLRALGPDTGLGQSLRLPHRTAPHRTAPALLAFRAHSTSRDIVRQVTLLQAVGGTCSSATPIQRVLEQRAGQVGRFRRSLRFIDGMLEQCPVSFKYRPAAPRWSRDKTQVFIENGAPRIWRVPPHLCPAASCARNAIQL
jgi:hypothetical protein